MKGVAFKAIALICSLAAFDPAFAAGALRSGFETPPASAKPRVWWHWMNGNVTKAGIRADLAWMKRVGIAGADSIDASIATPQVVKKRLIYMTPAWKDAFRYAVGITSKSGMELAINSSPGWSETGGPWVKPQDAMKKLVWSATPVDGPFHGVLPQPPSTVGPIQNAPARGVTPAVAALHFYRDAVVIAYRQPVPEPAPVAATSNVGPIDMRALADGDLTDGPTLAAPDPDADVWVRYDFGKPVQIQAVTIAVTTAQALGYATSVEVSDDGITWRHVADRPQRAQLQRFVLVQQTFSFAPTTGRYFRIVFRPAAPLLPSLRPNDPAPGLIAPPPAPPPARIYRLHDLVFHADAMVHEFEKKAGFAFPPRDFYTIASPKDFAPGTAIDPADVIDLTSRMKPDGTLDWTPPPGHWVVLRLGYSLTGAENHPATAEATGLEVDKLNARHVRDYLEHYLDTYEAVTGPKLMGRHGLEALVVDSAEIGMQNWTEDILAQFRRLRGYDPTPWLPALTGVAVKSPAASDKFLWDWRRTIEQLYAENHYGVIGAVARQRHLINYGEALEDHRPGFGDDMEMRRYTTIPMGAMWTYGEAFPSALTYEADLLGAASVSHVYGKGLVGAESLTSAGQPWAWSPRGLKPFIDMEFARGVNLVTIHTSVHQPVDRPPGLSLDGFGQFFNRLETWADQAGPWMRYIARCDYLLQQGRFAADVAYFYGEEAPITSLFGNKHVDVPQGYAFDFVDSDALMHQLFVDHGEVVTKSGMRYRVLYLGGSSRMMTLPTLERIRDLVADGAVVVGTRPVGTPSLADDPVKFQRVADELFGDGKAHPFGKGWIYPTFAEAFAALHLPPDFEHSNTDAETLFLHRKLKDGDLYFVSNRVDRPQSFMATFRVAGYAPQIWDAVRGTIAPASYRIEDGRTRVALDLPAYGSAFVVFRKPATTDALTLPAQKTTTVATLSGPWTIAFQPGRGAPPKIVETALAPWNDSSNPGVRYFSGTGTYTTSFTLPRIGRGGRLMLDLGKVREIASVSLNGKPLTTVWTPPFAVDITKAVRPGRNVLQVKVTNLWVNRLIGDAQPGIKKKYTFTIIPTYGADAPLWTSGLLGPVRIVTLSEK